MDERDSSRDPPTFLAFDGLLSTGIAFSTSFLEKLRYPSRFPSLLPFSSDTSIRFRPFKVATFACAPDSNQKTKQISKGCAWSAA